ncbi:MAG: FkbM family methyltransferase [Bacteroidia bacterium]|nr:FkbM family methyltransferase [Bacteroidia bacterium]
MKLKTKFFNLFRSLLKFQAAEKVIIPFTKNSSSDSFFSKIAPNYYQYEKPSFRKITRDGINFELDISDYMEWLLYFGIQAEPRQKLYHLAINKKVIFDIGGNFGETALYFARHAPKDAVIYVFEPTEACYRKLERNISLNSFNNIKPFQYALGNMEGRVHISSDNEHNRGGNKIKKDDTLPINAYVRKLDNVVLEENIPKIDLMKIDVEGYEYHVLKGAEQTIIHHRPLLFVEVNDEHLQYYQSSAKELISFLEKYYQRIVNAYTDKEVSSDMDFTGLHFDVIAYP